MGDAIQPREQAYLDLLHCGLVLLRNFAHTGDVELCRIEADHLHNIPTLLHEENQHRHEYYIREERGLYLQRLRAQGQSNTWSRWPLVFRAVAGAGVGAAGVRLPGWDQEAEPRAAPDRRGACRLPDRRGGEVEGSGKK